MTHLHNTSHKSEFKLHENDQKLDENIFSPPPLPRITRVKTLQLSSVILQDNLKIHSLYRPAHRNLLLLFLCYLKIISPQIFFLFHIHNIAKVATIAKLLYDPPFSWGPTVASDKEQLDKVQASANCWGYLKQSFPTVSKLANTADANLLFSILNNPKDFPHHLLHPLLSLHSKFKT